MPSKITRREFGAGLAATALAGRLQAQDRPPNIVYLISDDQHWADYSFLGHPHIETPRIDRLASESRCYTKGYVPAPLCCPSLAAILSGLYPHQSGITSNDPHMPEDIKKPEAYKSPGVLAQREQSFAMYRAAPMLPRLLAARGYASLQTGKWWGGAPANAGFTDGMTLGDPLRGGRHGDLGLKIGRDTMQPIEDFLEAHGRDPFFLWYAPMLPHQPHNPPDRLVQKYQSQTPSELVAKYWAMCEWWDETVGQVLDSLERRGLADNTVVVYCCDNGWIQDPDHPRYAPRSKRSVYEGGIRTPVMVRWPGRIQPEMDTRVPVSTIDIAPTVLRMCGLEPSPELQGIDLLDRFNLQRRGAAMGSGFTHDAIDVMNPAANVQWRWRVEERFKLIDPDPVNQPDDVPELYDLIGDPGEEQNLAAQYPRIADRMRRALDGWWTPERL